MNLKDLTLLPFAGAWLMVEFGGDSKEDADNKAKELMNDLKQKKNPPIMSLFDDPEQEHKLWVVRESSLGATAWVPGEPNGGPGWEDSAVEPDKVGDYVKDLRELFNKYDYHPSIYGHFGQGCVHCRVGFDFLSEEGIKKYKQFTVEASHLVVKYGGSLSGEHGDGQARGDLLEIMYGKELIQAFREFKAIWDPEDKMNPGKIVDTYGQLNNFRLGTTYDPPEVKTHFQFPDDDYSFNRATLKCVGVGECRRHEGGTMCPSYMVTREEKHSTRGRARMLFEMMQGDVTKGGWQDENVKESLDLCLSCKGCKSDCPVNVDMATYKAEFLSHYYKRKLRPRTAYAFGFVYWWSRLASLMPGFANFLMHAPLLGTLTKAIAGIDQHRKMPKYAEMTFREWFRERKQESGVRSQEFTKFTTTNQKSDKQQKKSKVILWTDTFNNFFLPETLVAATEVLETAGFEVIITKQSLCCGRPLYDFGMLNIAKKLLENIMQQLHEEILRGTPIVGLEPSCVAVFRDELHNLFPHEENATRLSKQVYTLAEFLEKEATDFKIPQLKQKAVVHGHCHHKAIMKMDHEKSVLKKMQLNHEILDSGCCGMAGYFGYEKGDHYDVSIKAGERVLLPAVRNADDKTIIIADGFSCREQIEQQTERKALHLAQVLQMALDEKDSTKSMSLPEKKYVDKMKLKDPNKKRNAIMIAGAFAAAFIAVRLIKNANSK
jgi:Fe-S oxidoreductase